MELRRVWGQLREEAVEAATWLGCEVPSCLTVEVQGVGEGSTTGTTRGKISEARHVMRGNMLVRGLEEHPRQHRDNRPVWAWLQRDKLSSAWLQALPGPDSSLTSAEFTEAAATALCLPSPSCVDKVGQTVRGRVVVDKHGDSIQATNLKGDHFRTRHDRCKLLINRMCQWSGLPCEMEVFNLFAGVIPQAGLNRMERGRKSQSIIPDLRISLPEEGNLNPSLHEIKVISSCETRYKLRRGGQEAVRAVDHRAGELQAEYTRKARNTDRAYCGTAEGAIGPVETKLITMGAVKGVVFGAFGECSKPLHELLQHMAVSRARVAEPQRGRSGEIRTEAAEIAQNITFLRRAFSVAAVKAQTFSLLGRLETLGTGGTAAERRREFAKVQDRQWSALRRAHALSVKQGRSVLRRGHFKLD